MNDDEDVESLVGRTITRALYRDDNIDQWGHHGDYWLWLDDGRVMQFSSTGYDADSPTLEEIEVVEIEDCLHCHKAHGPMRVHSAANFGFEKDLQPGQKYAFCRNGKSRAWIATPQVPEG